MSQIENKSKIKKSNKDIIDEFKKLIEEMGKLNKNNHVCPHCGRCPTCGQKYNDWFDKCWRYRYDRYWEPYRITCTNTSTTLKPDVKPEYYVVI